MAEIFDIVDENDVVIGQAERSEVHGNPELFHRVAHVHVFNRFGYLFLQKRSKNKDLQPGKWDTSVGGHVDSGESYLAAAVRETAEELGIIVPEKQFEFLYKYSFTNDYESELVSTYRIIWDRDFHLQESELDDGRFWSMEEIQASSESFFTPNFLSEFDKLRHYMKEK
ncbi:MAG: NUDIX domain-containing protein [Spirochaetales bacterium]|nr:NUDIX domain-containing protein [Spirochaetales bacterium]